VSIQFTSNLLKPLNFHNEIRSSETRKANVAYNKKYQRVGVQNISQAIHHVMRRPLKRRGAPYFVFTPFREQ
jgi:hypothetical protein